MTRFMTMIAVLTGAPAHAAIVSSTSVLLAPRPPPSAEEGVFENQTQLGGWVEVERITLPRDVAVDLSVPGTYGHAGDPPFAPGTLAAGTAVSSYYFHGDSTGQTIASWNGFVTFDTPILAIQLQAVTFVASDDIFNVGGVVFDPQPFERDFDTDLFNDFITWDPADPYTVRFDHAADTGIDEFRVITAATWLEITGTCPGPVDIRWAGASPGGTLAFLSSPTPGTTVIPVGPCAGGTVDLAMPVSLRAMLSAGPAGRGGITPTIASPAVCSHSLQVVDMSTCLAGPVVELP